ncbi:MAG: hypothetical protein WC723_05000 [Candidatus Omnitrophota bacterium]
MVEIFGITISGAVVFGAVIWLLEHQELYDRIKAGIIKPFIKRRENLQKIYIASDIQNKINTFTNSVSREIGEKEKCKVKIEWVDKESKESFFKDDKLIIRMDYKDNMHRNLSLATLVFVSESLIRKTRPYIDKTLNNAIDLMVTKKILEEEANEQEKDYYNNVFMFPQLENSKELRDVCKNIEFMGQKGYFTRLFLRELKFLGESLQGSLPTDEVKNEVNDFMKYIVILSNSPLVQEGGHFLAPEEFRFERRYLKIRVILFAWIGNVTLSNIRPYFKRVKEGLKEGAEIFYLLSAERSLELLEFFDGELRNRLVKHGLLKKIDDRTYLIKKSDRKEEKHRCIIYRKLKALKGTNWESIFENISP